ncbi:hypothetical protein LCGC14_0661210 [marine sediment metagenome]|uniref:Phytochrome sensor protein n=1 Tax=marine sediment metagenome TaxID=412755 RepID=A0A0F9QTH4_9ZZZZ|nr:DUF484 family protein [Methylophaga sp.]
MGEDQLELTTEQVATYLKKHPDFFISEPAVLDSLQLSTSPEGTISLAQRQLDRSVQKNEKLQTQLNSLLFNARKNNELQSRVHQLCLRLMDAKSLDELLPLLMNEFKREFEADEVTLRLFYNGDAKIELPKLADNIVQHHIDDEDFKVFDRILAKQQPVCGRLTQAQKNVLFADKAEQVQSVACLPLGHEPCAGLLAIASFNENRFHADMATDYLSFLGEITMRLLRPYHHELHGE